MQNCRTFQKNAHVYRSVYITFCCCFIVLQSWAQSDIDKENTFCDPGISGQPRPKFLEITRGTSSSFPVQNISQIDGIQNGNAQVVDNSTLEIKVKAPVLLKPGFKVFTGVKYFKEDFEFNSIDNPSDLYFRQLHRKSLRSVRGSIYGIKSFRGNTYLATRVSASLNGDKEREDEINDQDYLNFSVAALFGWKKSESFVFGVGLAYTNMFGVNRVYPVVGIEKAFNQQWGFEALLPKTASIRYTSRDSKNNFYGTLNLDGGTYRVRFDDLFPSHDLILQRNEVQLKLNYEREIYDWIWFGIEAGVRKYIGADLAFPGDEQSVIYETQFGTNAFANFSIFLVPPRKLLSNF